jgi:SAM-dependent methyltransferase
MVAATEARAAEAGVSNFSASVRDFVADGTGRPDASAGYAMLFNILHVEDPVGLLREALRTLAPGGRAGAIHWKHDPNTPRGPSLAIRPTQEQCRAWAERARFHFVRYEELCCCSSHWGMVLERPGQPASTGSPRPLLPSSRGFADGDSAAP